MLGGGKCDIRHSCDCFVPPTYQMVWTIPKSRRTIRQSGGVSFDFGRYFERRF